jgi:outer membrane protein insertion porin family
MSNTAARCASSKSPTHQTGTIDLTYEVEEGNKSFIEKVEIKGNTKTKDRVIRRELSVSPGELFDMTRVKLSRQRLEGLNYFERVDTEAEPDPNLPPDRKNLVITVAEKNTGNFSVGAGYSSIDNLLGFIEITQGNFDLFNPPKFMGARPKDAFARADRRTSCATTSSASSSRSSSVTSSNSAPIFTTGSCAM